ncbi:hypothetical protein [Nocardia africana]|uniref:Uncharacterized protein n=1 Tax=Nocardia africana TaxID=134964 RepID=A0ABW6NCV5_9NOCA
MVTQLVNEQDPRLSEDAWSDYVDWTPEWVRHYRCYRLEAWARQLAVSAFLHIGCENRTLVLEWHTFVLPPIAPQFRAVDLPPDRIELHILRTVVAELALLPTTIPRRISELFRRRHARWSRPDWSTPELAAHAFGSAASLRELVADSGLNNFFQRTDADRYLKILEHRMLDAVRRFLSKNGITAKGLEEMVTQINNSAVITNSTVVAANIAGQGDVGTVSGVQSSGGAVTGKEIEL